MIPSLTLALDPHLMMPVVEIEKDASLLPSGGWSAAERGARMLAAQKGGLPSFVGNTGIRSGAGLGALAGAAYGAISPGHDEEGNERGAISGALRGATRGAIFGGAAGGLTKHLAAPTINSNLPGAREEMAGKKASVTALYGLSLPFAAPAPAPVQKEAAAVPAPAPASVPAPQPEKVAAKEPEMKVCSGVKVPVLAVRG